MLPEDPPTLNASEKLARFQLRMRLLSYALLHNVSLLPTSVFQFLHMLVVEGTLSIPSAFMLPFEARVAGQIILANQGSRLLPERDQSDHLAVKQRSKVNFLLISCFFVSKVLVGSLLEHKVAKRANFVSLRLSEKTYFSQYAFTMLAVLTDILFETFA